MKHAPWMALMVLTLTSCTRSGPSDAQVRKDFDAICKAQGDYVSSRELMKNAEGTELLTERNRRMSDGRTTEPGLRAVEALVSAGAGSARAKVEEAARAGGLKDWSCPAL
jgi:uncharacterized protein YbaP (TraB family)